MSDFIEVRDGARFQLDGHEYAYVKPLGGADLELKTSGSRHSDSILFGEFVGSDWEVMRPYPTEGADDEIDPDVFAVLVKRSKRYRTALAARAFIEGHDLHEDPGPVSVRALFRKLGGTFIQPGGLTDRDENRYPGRTARIHGPGDITMFLKDDEDLVRRNELIALTIAAYVLDESLDQEYHRGLRDLSLGGARRDHTEAHLFAAMLLVPQENAAHAVSIVVAEEIGDELNVDPATVQDAHQLWDEITNPELPRAWAI